MPIILEIQKYRAISEDPIFKMRNTTLIHVHFVDADFTGILVVEMGSEDVDGRVTVDAVLQDGSKLVDDIVIRSRDVVREDAATSNLYQRLANVIKTIFTLKLMETDRE